MIYQFKTKASADLIMLEPQGEQTPHLIGRAPGPKGIIERQDMPQALAALKAAAG